MSKRLHVVMDDADLRKLRKAAKAKGVTVSEWVRTTLREAMDQTPRGDSKRKLDVIRAAAQYDFPAPVLGHLSISARDAIHAAVMKQHGIETILSFDQDYDRIPGIRRLSS